jgi:signal transduction histidine kinase
MLATDQPAHGGAGRGHDDPMRPSPASPGGRPRPSAHRLEREIEAELVTHLVRQARRGLTGFGIGALTVAAVLVVLWDAAPRGLLLGWTAAIGLLTLPAVVLVLRFPDAPGAAIASWRRGLGVAYGLAGAGWGLAAILLYPRVATPYQLFLLFVLGGSGVGGMVALASVPEAYVGYLSATFLPMIGELFAEGTHSSAATGVLLALFWAATIAVSSELRALLVQSMRLRFENFGLIDDLSGAKDAAEAASRAKSAFLANVSHELRTPLTLILGPTRKLLDSGACGADARRDLETVERNARVLLKHVSDLLDITKLEAGRMTLERSRADLVALVRRTASLFEAVARERRVALAVDTPAVLFGAVDAEKLEHVVLNLLSNAIKFVPDGGRVQLRLGVAGDEVVLSVEDDGPGVPVALRQAIFERFRRGDDAATGRVGGTGLGLAIARELVECHGGRIQVGDAPSGGARFAVTLPLAQGAPVTEAPAAARPAAREELDAIARQTVAELRRHDDAPVASRDGASRGLVLVIEDNPEMRRFLVDGLAPDYRVATAADARRGLETALELRPDLVVSDVMMPGMGGDALVHALRAHPVLGDTPIIVLTAKADDALRVRLLRSGAQDFLIKPASLEELRARVANAVMMKRTRDVLQSALSSQGRDLATLADQLAAANRAKDEFLAVLSHELRTPLTPILSWSFLLRSGQLDAAATRHALDTIERSAKLQVRIVEDLLDVSRAITGKLRLDLRPIALAPVVHAAMDAVQPAATAKGVVLEATLEPDVGRILGDAERLQQVLWNLLSNAIKFTPRGGRVDVRLGRAGEQVRLAVADDGVGIRPAVLPRLFERFWQADASPARAQGGLGLGLAVVRHLVELHGGTVGAASEGEGRGATFVVTLPALPPRTSADASPPAPPVAEELGVLVVDDDLDTCRVVEEVLQRAGADVRACLSASRALTIMESWLPDVLVSDIGMPDTDGYALIRAVRAREAEAGGRVLAVALTAYGSDEDRSKALAAGFQVHLGKPIEPRELVSVLAGVAGDDAATRH